VLIDDVITEIRDHLAAGNLTPFVEDTRQEHNHSAHHHGNGPDSATHRALSGATQ
jgi:hypothetical protein